MAIVHYTAPPILGGVEGIVASQAALLSAAGYEVRVVAGRGDCIRVPELDSRHPQAEALYRALAAGQAVEGAYGALKRRLAEQLAAALAGVDVVIAHNLFTMPFNLPAAEALAGLGKPVLAWTHDIAWVNPRYDHWRHDRPPYDIVRRPQPNCTYVVISKVRQTELASLFGQPAARFPLIPNGIDPEAFLGAGPHTIELLQAAGLAAARPLLLIPFRVTRRKRLELAIESAAILLDSHPRLGIAITGPLGPHATDNHAYLDELLALRGRLGLDRIVRFMAELSPRRSDPHPVLDSDMAALYRLADAVLMPSESEGFGLPVLEAAVARVPLVCADLPVLVEVGGAGLYRYPAAGRPEQVAQAVERALASKAARFRRRILDRYGWQPILEQTELAIARVVAGG